MSEYSDLRASKGVALPAAFYEGADALALRLYGTTAKAKRVRKLASDGSLPFIRRTGGLLSASEADIARWLDQGGQPVPDALPAKSRRGRPPGSRSKVQP